MLDLSEQNLTDHLFCNADRHTPLLLWRLTFHHALLTIFAGYARFFLHATFDL
jgi:hypothetical protein